MDPLKRCEAIELALWEEKASRHRLALALSLYLGLPTESTDEELLKALAVRGTGQGVGVPLPRK